jgi:hypothetical protein
MLEADRATRPPCEEAVVSVQWLSIQALQTRGGESLLLRAAYLFLKDTAFRLLSSRIRAGA